MNRGNQSNQNNMRPPTNTTSTHNAYNRNQYQAKNGYSTNAYETNVNKNANSHENYDEDLLDISDSELIRASQVVESQLKFTNNVHQTTSNALNIFSQFNSTNNQNCLMPAPSIYPSSTNMNNGGAGTAHHQQPSQYNYQHHNQPVMASQFQHLDGDPVAQLEQLNNELKQIKTENMQKDGEVKILRDKLKRLEQDAQRMRTERSDLVKKLEQKQEETKKSLQKQIEFKELENQFKSQEIVELTMKYKYLESAVKKNPAIISSTPMPMQQTTTTTTTPQSSSAIHSNKPTPSLTPKTMSTKRNNSSMQFDNELIENRRPDADFTRHSTNMSNNGHGLAQPQSPQPNVNIIRPNAAQGASPFNKNNNAQVLFQNTTNLATHPPLNGKVNANDFKEPSKPASRELAITNAKSDTNDSHSTQSKCASNKKLERACVLSTRLQRKYKTSNEMDNKEDIIYEITDLFAEHSNYLYKFNSLTFLNHRITNLNVVNLNKKLADLLEFMKSDLKSKFANCLKTQQPQSELSNSSSSQNKIIERIEFVSNRLNNELIKLLTYCLNSYNNYDDTNDLYTSNHNNNNNNNNKSETCSSMTTTTSLANNSSSITLHSLSNNLNTTNNSKQSINNSAKPATNFSIIDILCMSFEICFQLFLFRLNYLLDDYETRKEKTMRLKSTFFTRINTLRQDFFLLILNLLNSINMNKEELSKQQQQQQQVVI